MMNLNQRVSEIVRGVVDKYLKEKVYLVEYKQINHKDNGRSLFPGNKFNIGIYAREHWPPHFHVAIEQDWDIAFHLEDGKLYHISKEGRKAKMYNYIVSRIYDWLSLPSMIDKTLTNKGALIRQWNQFYPQWALNEDESCFVKSKAIQT